jgi:hypothetical protein
VLFHRGLKAEPRDQLQNLTEDTAYCSQGGSPPVL